MRAKVSKSPKKAKGEPKPTRGKPMNLNLHAPDEGRRRELGKHTYEHCGLVSNSQVVKAALIAANPDERLLQAFDVAKSRDLRFRKS